MKKKSDRYKTAHLVEDQFEPGSNGQVLKNKLGLTSPEKMDDAEAIALKEAMDKLVRKFDQRHRFTATDLCSFHKIWFVKGTANVIFFDREPASETPWTKKLWIYDFRTNIDFTLKTNPLKREDLDEFVKCYNPENRHTRKPTWSEKNPDGRWRAFDCEELINRDKASLDIFWLKDQSLEDSDNLPEPEIIAREIVTDLQNALVQFQLIAEDLGEVED